MKAEKGNLAILATVEAVEVIEMKRIVLDRDVPEAKEFFRAVIAPQVIAAAERFGIHGAGVESALRRRCAQRAWKLVPVLPEEGKAI